MGGTPEGFQDVADLHRKSISQQPVAVSPTVGERTAPFLSLDAREIRSSAIDVLVSQFLDALLRRRDFSAPSAWLRHWSSIHALMSLQRPRRFVELGTHYGFSLVAAAKAAQYFEVDCELIGIDSWSGDHQAGFYTQEVYDSVLDSVLQERLSTTFLMKGSFEAALSQFEDGSIDMLHIDGLHTYSSVAQDFTSWLPKLSKEGIVILHDTQVVDGDFGVHRLWKSLEASFLTINLLHGHGLGIVIPDTARETPVGLLASHLRSDALLSNVVIDATKHLSELISELAVVTEEAAEKRRLADECARLEEKVASLHSERGSLRIELRRLRGRRAVRLSLALAGLFRPAFRTVRSLRRKIGRG